MPSLRSRLVQTEPVYRKPMESLAKLPEIPANIDLDIIIFPELGFSGYIFDSREDIDSAGVLEPVTAAVAGATEKLVGDPRFTLVTWQYMVNLAKQRRCHVVFSAPEVVLKVGLSDSTIAEPEGKEKKRKTEPEILSRHISQFVVSPEGKLLKAYRKHALWGPDCNWADPGEEGLADVVELEIRGQTLRCGLGICLDLLQYWNRKWEKCDTPWEIASRYQELSVDVVLFSTAEPLYDEVDFLEFFREETNGAVSTPEEAIGYVKANRAKLWETAAGNKRLLASLLDRQWTEPLKPLFEKPDGGTAKKNVLYLCCNRVGSEREHDENQAALFAGATAVYVLNPTEGRAELKGNLGISCAGVLGSEVDF